MSLNKKAILGVIAALIVGGLGNGVWQYVLEPALTWSLAGILNIATLGVQSFKDDLYREIAKGFHEDSSLSLANALYFWVGYGVVFGLFLFTRKTKSLVSRNVAMVKKLDDLEATAEGHSEPIETKDDVHVRISNLRTENLYLAPKVIFLHKTAYLIFAFGIAFFAWMVIGNVKARYINSAITHYEQSLAIVTPLATDKELAAFKSRFARVASKGEYDALMTEIARVGDHGGFKVPDFNAW